MIKNATVQLPEIQVVKIVLMLLQACDSAHIAREAMETLHGNLQLELKAFTGLCQEFEMLRENVKGDGNCMPSSVAQGMLWCVHILGDEGGKLRRTDREELSLSIRTEDVEWCVQHSAKYRW